MIDGEQLRPLIDAMGSDNDPEHHRLLLEALTALRLTEDAWRVSAPSVQRALIPVFDAAEFSPDFAVLAARLPLRTVRSRLRRLARDADSPSSLTAALALAEVGDTAGVTCLLRQLQKSPTAYVARALAILPLDESEVTAADLAPGIRTGDDGADDETRMWTAIALARLSELEPLESLWDALVRPPEFFERSRRAYLFREPPPHFHGNPARTVGDLARVRPLPQRVVNFILGLRRNDYDDAWMAKNSELVGDSRNAILFVAGLAGTVDQYGGDVTDAPAAEEAKPTPAKVAAATRVAVRLRTQAWRNYEPNVEGDDLRLLRHAPAELAAEVMERGIEQLDTAAVVAKRIPGYALGNALVALAAAFPRFIPLRVARALTAPAIRCVPVESISWAMARAGSDVLLKSLTPYIAGSEGSERTTWLNWLVQTARQIDAPAPYLGAGGSEAIPQPVMELVDDMPRKTVMGERLASLGEEDAELELVDIDLAGGESTVIVDRSRASTERGTATPKKRGGAVSRSGKRARPPKLVRASTPAPTREVFPDIGTETPHPIAGTPLAFVVSLGASPTKGVRGSVRVPERKPTGVHTLHVHLLVGDQSAWDTLDYSIAAGTTRPAKFSFTTPAVDGDRALIEVRCNFYLNNRWCGEGSRNLDVRRDATVPTLGEIPIPPAPPWRNGLALELDATPPDLIVRIQRAGGVGEYTWSCLSPHVALPAPDDPLDSQMALGEDAAAFVRRAFGPLANIPLKRVNIATVQGVGETIYRSTPTHFKDSYWKVWDVAQAGGFPFESIQVVTDEPFIPWELMRVYDAARGPGVPAEFVAVRHSVGRWLATETSGPPQRIPVTGVVVAASDYSGIASVSNKLPWAKEENDLLVNTHHATAVPLTSDAVLQLLEEGHAQAVHFACHGRMVIANPNESQLVMEDTPNDVTPPLVARAEVCEGLGKDHPLVFLNACEVGGSAAALSLVAGFPGAFLYAGASALVSPLWVVNDERACEIAKDFYAAVLTPGHHTPIGQLLRDVRKRWVKEQHLTYLAYVLYGDPLAWVDYRAPAAIAPTTEPK
jgi:hypothetical protein